MVYRDWLRDEMEAGRVSERVYQRNIRRVCRRLAEMRQKEYARDRARSSEQQQASQ